MKFFFYFSGFKDKSKRVLSITRWRNQWLVLQLQKLNIKSMNTDVFLQLFKATNWSV